MWTIFLSELPQRLWVAVVLALKRLSAAQLSEAVQRGGGLYLLCLSYHIQQRAYFLDILLVSVHTRSSWNKALPARRRTVCRISICPNTDRFSATWPSTSTISSSPSWRRASLLPLVFQVHPNHMQVFDSVDLKCAASLPSPSVPGMLEHESLQGISSMKPTGFRKRSNSIYEDSETYTISSIIQQLSVFHSTMSQHGMEQGLVKQAVKQLFFLVGATTFNNIMLRKDMCSCRKGMQIRSVVVCVWF